MTDRKNLEIQLAHAQKMESIGHLAAGVAHELNTPPIQYIGDNVSFLKTVFAESLSAYKKVITLCTNDGGDSDCSIKEDICKIMDNFDFNFIKTESEEAIEQTLDGISRVSSIVKAMKTFSHPGTSDKNLIDINKSIETTLTISKNEWKYHCNVITDFDPNLPPEVYGYHDDLNQVFLNMIINASHSIEEKYSKENKMGGNITISTMPQMITQ